MHCGASLIELHDALVFHRKCLGKRLGHQMYIHAGVCGATYIALVCAHFMILEREKGGNTGLAHTALWSGKNPRHIVASTTFEQLCQLHELATPIIQSHFPPHCSTPYSTPAIIDT